MAALATLTLTGLVQAQSAPTAPAPDLKPAAATGTQLPNAETDDVVVLSPFEVNAAADEGYAAANSLAGNRLNTELKDVGSAISVVTSQMLRDIGATSNETLLQYTTNTEVGNIYGNMANAGGGTQLDETSKFVNPNQNTRVRGLASADSTVDYFITSIPWDGYNVDRVDMQRGPNAMLFGYGSPAGIINAGTKTATFKNKGEVEFRYSRFGSTRTTLDVNRVILPGELAIRVSALLSKEKFQQDPAYQDDKRIYGALRYEPGFLNKGSAHTTLKANYERGYVRSNRPRTLTPNDAITPWFYSGTGTGYDAKGVPFTYRNMNRLGFDARGVMDGNIATTGQGDKGEFVKNYNNSNPTVYPNGMLNPYWQPWLGGQYGSSYFGNPLVVLTNPDAVTGDMWNYNPTTPRGINSLGVIDKGISGIPDSRMSTPTAYRDFSKKVNLAGAKFGLTKNFTLSDPSIFDFYNQLMDGPNKSEWSNFNRYNLNLSQTFFNGQAGFEAVYDKQHYDSGQIIFLTDKGQQLNIDVTKILADGTTNPNYGRPFLSDTGASSNWGLTDREASRFTAFATHDFGKKRKNWVARVLGRHVLTGLYSNDSARSENYSFVKWAADNSYKDFVNGYGSAAQWADSNVRKVEIVYYLGPSLANAASAAGAYIPNPKTKAKVNSGSVRVYDSTWNAPTVNPAAVWENPNYAVGHPYRNSTQSENPANYIGWVQAPITIVDATEDVDNRQQNMTGASRSKSNIKSEALTWQAYFWDGAVVGMAGYRNDKAKGWAVNGLRDTITGVPNTDRTGGFALPATPFIVEDISKSWSAVVHLNTLLKHRLPIDIGLFYNKSENFQPKAGRINVLGDALPPPTGNTKEIGIRFSTKDGNYSLKVNKYETKVVNSDGTHGFNYFYLHGMLVDYQKSRNRYVFEVSDPTNPATYHQGDPGAWNYQATAGQTAEQAHAEQVAATTAWDAMIKGLPAAYPSAWRINFNQTQLSDLATTVSATNPVGFNAQSIIEDNVSKGYEIELYARPIPSLRLTANVSKQEASRANIGDLAWNNFITQINTALNLTAAGNLRSTSGTTSATALQAWNANFWASWLSIKGAEGGAVGELRPWRANVIANYDFNQGFLKGVNVGAGYRWQDKVVIGYEYNYYLNGVLSNANPWTANTAALDLSRPFYGPAETNIDLWIGYHRKLTAKIDWRVQLNVRNVGKGNSLIPVTVQPDGTVAGYRIAPTQVWSLSNTFEF